jgi:hypothetical protein
LPEIVEFELTIKKGRYLSLLKSEVNSIPKEYRQSIGSKGFFDEITIQDFPIRGHIRYISRAEDGLTRYKSLLEIEFSSRRNSGNMEFASFKRNQ